jgi:transcriptional regulator with XRE-family HTH domain
MTLKDKISNLGIKQKFIADKLSISPAYLSMMLNGNVVMSEEIRNKINELLPKATA